MALDQQDANPDKAEYLNAIWLVNTL